MAEIPGPSENLGKSPGGDRRHSRLLADFLFGDEPEGAGSALDRLRVDNNRRSLGMTEQERARAAAVDELKERMPGLIRTGAVVSLSWVVGERLAEHFPNMRVALGSAGVGLFASGAAVETTYKLMYSREMMHPKVAVLATSLAVLRPFARLAMEIGAGISGGVVTRGVLDGFQAAAQQAGAGGGEQIGPDWQGGHADRVLGDESGKPISGLEPPGEQVGQEHRWGEPPEYAQQGWQAPEAPAASGEPSWGQPPGYEETLRQAALQLGPTVAELAAQMPKQTVSEAIYQMIGDVPHRGEVTNILFRAIGDKVNSLNQGAIKAAAEALRPVFDNIDQTVAGSGVPYTEGGRAAVEAMRGFNSPEAQAVRAANIGDLEAAGNLFNKILENVLRPVLR